MTDELSAEADRRLEKVLAERGGRDPREYYRERLRELKQSSPEGYQAAVAYYRDVLIPTVAAGEVAPLDAWTEYGRRLADAAAPGRTVSVDPSGRAHPFEAPCPDDHLVIHLPEEARTRALVVGLPGTLSPAQRATYDLLVEGRQKLPD